MWLVAVNTHFSHNDAVHPVSLGFCIAVPLQEILASQDVPRWEQLYNSAPLKEACMGSITGHRTGYLSEREN